jgi:hypothetical protein
MVKFGDTTLPLVVSVQEIYRKLYVERPIPGGTLAKRQVCGTIGLEYRVSGIVSGADIDDQIAALKALADGTARDLDLEDGSAAVSCLMVDLSFQYSGNSNRVPYEALFIQSA